jgi:hypothetical protein
MSPEVARTPASSQPPSPWAILSLHARAGATLLRLEMKVLTGNRLVVVAGIELLWLAVFGVWQHLRSDPWPSAWFYNGTVVLPGMLPAIALGMAAVLGESDIRHLEMSLASPGGRYQIWSFRLAALSVACVASTFGCAILTWAFIDHGLSPLVAAAHAVVPLVFVGVLTVALSLAFNGASSAALVTAGVVALSGIILHESFRRFDLFLNPFDPPEALHDPAEWFRMLVFNRAFYAVLTGLAVALALWLLQKRERLL